MNHKESTYRRERGGNYRSDVPQETETLDELREQFQAVLQEQESPHAYAEQTIAALLAESVAVLTKRLAEIEQSVAELHQAVTEGQRSKEWYTIAETSELLGRAEFTVREWCRLGRVYASKRACGRGPTQEWIVADSEIDRIRNEGLLPM